VSNNGAAQVGSALSRREIREVLLGAMVAMFLAALDQTIVASAIRTIGDDLHGLSVQAWVTTAYLITSTITTPLYGKLSDLYGRKPFFLAAITIFIIGSALCTFSTSMYMLAGFRALQGVGAGGLFSLALAIIGDIVPPRERARYQGYFLAVFGTSSVLGPVVGGFLAGRSSILGISGWRWVFLVNVPIALLALVVVARTLNIPHHRRDHSLDFAGAAALVVALVPLLTVLEQGRSWGWGSGRSVGCYAIALLGLIAFVVAERRIGDDALIPMRFFRDRTFTLSTIGGILTGAAMFGGLALLPLYLQIVKGATPTESGLMLLPLTVGLMVGSLLSGQLISRTGRYKVFPVGGTALMVVGMTLLHFVGADTPLAVTGVYMAVFGFGLGNVMQPITLAVQNALPPRDIGVATSSATFFRQMGATIGTAVFLSVLFSTVGNNIATALRKASDTASFKAALADPRVQAAPGNQRLLGILHNPASAGGSGTINDTSFLNGADKRLAHPFFVGFSTSMDLVFLIAAGVLVIALVVMAMLRELPLRTTSGIEAAGAERAAQAGQGGAALGPAGELPVGVGTAEAGPEASGGGAGGRTAG
jgi:EmrB/QacA subfamily drug resistance transporter